MSMDLPRDDTLGRLADIVDSRHGGDPDASYVARLFSKGADAILKKVGEEASEVVMAAKDLQHAPGDAAAAQRLVGEMADLWFHGLVTLSHFGLRPEAVLAELRRREGMSGLEEFALRKVREREAAEAAQAAELAREAQRQEDA